MNHELDSGETKAPKTQWADQPATAAAALSWATRHRRADNVLVRQKSQRGEKGWRVVLN